MEKAKLRIKLSEHERKPKLDRIPRQKNLAHVLAFNSMIINRSILNQVRMAAFQTMVLTILIILSCKNKTDKKIDFSDSVTNLKKEIISANADYKKVEIYCWCFLDSAPRKRQNGSTVRKGKTCNTLIRLEPSILISPENLLDSTNDTTIIKSLQNIIFIKKESSIKINDGIDSRFVILFRTDEFSADTIAYSYMNNSKLWYNRKELFSYSFRVMDSIRSVLGKPEINCDSD